MRIAILILGLFITAACTAPTNRPRVGQPMPQQTFAHIAAQPVRVAAIDIRDESQGAAPGDFTFSLPDQTQRYVRQKFEASGSQGLLRIRILEADVGRGYIPAQGGFTKSLNVGGMDEYTLKLRLVLEHVGADGRMIFGKEITATNRLRVSEHCALADRERDQLGAVEALFNLIDPKVTQIVSHEMGL